MSNTQFSESFRAASILALTGGFLESYSFLLHGHVFANAQTGNIALCGMAVASQDWLGAIRYLIPICAFALGVFGVDWVRSKWPQTSAVHWRQGIVLAEAALLCGCFFARSSQSDMIANLIVSVACALQVQTFRKVRGSAYASTMCTGNLRSATVVWGIWRQTRQPEAKRQSIRYLGIIAVFATGAACAVPFIKTFKEASIAVPIALLVLCAGLMTRIRPSSTSRTTRKLSSASDDADCD